MIPEIFRQDNIVYHYTKTQDVIKHILFQNQLRLSPRVNSIDPFENTQPIILECSVDYEENPILDKIFGEQAIEKVKRKLAKTKQLCFCMNDKKYNLENNTNFPSDYYGFMKPRMWDQYGDHYKGVCLAFDLEKLKVASNYKNNPIEYVNYRDLTWLDRYFDLNELHGLGDDYCTTFLSKMDKILFCKHKDYSGENEYRFLSQSDNEYDYINIEDSLVGIIVPRKNNTESELKELEKYAKDFNVELLYIDWSSAGSKIKNSQQVTKAKFHGH
jgi:hypothetical protein